jgi:D-alanyl-lipoteichoic acid acyltransferase DltB (MBOAT superfamily)
VLFGLWHAFDLNYLVWGIGNGLGVSFVHFGKNKKIFPLIKSNSPAKMVVAVITGAISLFYVAWLQTFANLDAIGTSIALTRKLLTG